MAQHTALGLVFICSVVLLSVDCHSKMERQVRKINRRVKNVNDTMETMLNKIEALTDITEKCETAVNYLSDKLNVGQPQTEGSGTSSSMATINLGNYSTITINVPANYQPCLDEMLARGDVTPHNANVWCTRLVLWQHNASLYIANSENDLIDTQLNGNDITINGNVVDPSENDVEPNGNDVSNEEPNIRKKRSSSVEIQDFAGADITSPGTGFRIRREYRMLSRNERRRFHNAVRALNDDGTLRCFSEAHRAALRSGGAHNGVAFLPWHRVFISLFEEALRRVDPRVSLPYWDSSIDFQMNAPISSVMWDAEHLGNNRGEVTTGPFSDFTTDNSPLLRSVGGSGSLITPTRLANAMSVCRLQEFRPRWENPHNGVHNWVGGTMARRMAASDPVFYMHHCFVDYQWEKFRQRQINNCFIDPTEDYPPVPPIPPIPPSINSTIDPHHESVNMTQMTFVKNIDGIRDYWTSNWFGYEDTPSCANNCHNNGSPDILNRCRRRQNACVGRRVRGNRRGRRDTGKINEREKRGTDDITNSTASASDCSKNPYASSCNRNFVPQPQTAPEIAAAIARGEMPMPDEIADIDMLLEEMRQQSDASCPPSDPVYFLAPADEPSDCRTLETCVYDLVMALSQDEGGIYGRDNLPPDEN